MYIHSDKYKCSECEKCFRGKRDLSRHRQIHSGEKPFGCSVCGKRFTRADSLTVHSRIHSGDKPCKCSLCDKSFSASGHLRYHERCIHSNVRPHSCSYCGKQFATVTDMKCHVRVHIGAKSYSCRHCSEEFIWHHQLKEHLLKSHNEGTWFTCHICQKKFIFKSKLKRHIQRHEGVKSYVATNVQNDSVQHVNWNVISQFTQTSDSSAVSCAMWCSNVKKVASNILRNVPLCVTPLLWCYFDLHDGSHGCISFVHIFHPFPFNVLLCR